MIIIKNSYVTIIKLGENLYVYIVNLFKDGSKIEDDDDDQNPTKIDFGEYKKVTTDETDQLDYDEMENKERIYYTNKSVRQTFSIEDEDGIIAYNYRIYKNNIIVYNSEYITLNTNSSEDNLKLDTNDHENVTYQIEVIVYYKKSTVKSKKVIRLL